MDASQQSAVTRRLPGQVGLLSAFPLLQPLWSLCLLTAGSIFFLLSRFSFWSFIGFHAQAGGSALQRWVRKSTNLPNLLHGSHPMWFALGLITCVYSFTKAVWPFLWMWLSKKLKRWHTHLLVFALLVVSITGPELGKCCYPCLCKPSQYFNASIAL